MHCIGVNIRINGKLHNSFNTESFLIQTHSTYQVSKRKVTVPLTFGQALAFFDASVLIFHFYDVIKDCCALLLNSTLKIIKRFNSVAAEIIWVKERKINVLIYLPSLLKYAISLVYPNLSAFLNLVFVLKFFNVESLSLQRNNVLC